MWVRADRNYPMRKLICDTSLSRRPWIARRRNGTTGQSEAEMRTTASHKAAWHYSRLPRAPRSSGTVSDIAGIGNERGGWITVNQGDLTALHLGYHCSIDAMRKVRGPATLLVALRIVGIAMMALRAHNTPQMCAYQLTPASNKHLA